MTAEPSLVTRSRHPRSQRPKVIYVMGAGRSGSTMLGVTLGNCDGVFYAGELDKWLLRSGEPKLGGEQRTAFWSAVKQEVPDARTLYGPTAHRYLERSSALFEVRGPSVRASIRESYLRVTADLYRAIAARAEATHVVDTSHYPLRARQLQSLDAIELYLLLLVREPQQVIASFARADVQEPRFNPAKTRAYLLLTHLLSSWVFQKHPPERRFVVANEDFAADPEDVLRRLLDYVGSSAPIPDLTSLKTGIPLQGNRLIREDVVSLRPPSSTRRPGPLARALNFPTQAPLVRLKPRIVSAARASDLASLSEV
jgi:Sulfotransferase family